MNKKKLEKILTGEIIFEKLRISKVGFHYQISKPLAVKPAIVKRPKAKKPSTSPVTSSADTKKSNRLGNETRKNSKKKK